jgi:protein-S-isoprenylcysteine O-methyltransferase Ste14
MPATKYSSLAARVRVPVSFVLGAIYLWFADPTPLRLAVGAFVSLIGLALRAVSAGHLRKNRELATSGPYAYTRNPLYLGSALAGIGFTIAGGQWWFLFLLALYFAMIYPAVMRREAAQLLSLFGERYAAYARAVPLLLPRLSPWEGSESIAVRFDLRQYRANREYEALLAFVLFVLVLWGKMQWRG